MSRWLWILLIVSLPVVGWLGFKGWQWGATPPSGPRIGLASDTAWHARAGLSNTPYQQAITRAGGHIEEFWPGDGTAAEILDRVDGLVIAGGYDVNPQRFGGDPKSAVTPDDARDALELELIKGAQQRGLPVLGICRGLQILNVAHGGTLRALRQHATLGPAHGGRIDWDHVHDVDVLAGTRLAAIEGAGRKTVNSFHGQGIDRVGDGLQVAARSVDGVVEALERKDGPFLLGVQWHPEVLSLHAPNQLGPIRALVKEAQRYRDR